MGVSPTKGCASCQKKMHGRKVMHLLNSTTFDNVLMILMLIFWSWAAHGPLMGCSILALCLLYACSTLALCSLYALSMLSLCSRTWVGHEMGMVLVCSWHEIGMRWAWLSHPYDIKFHFVPLLSQNEDPVATISQRSCSISCFFMIFALTLQ